MKTYLITGAAGFIGANFIKYMLAKYPEIKIVVLDLLTYAGNLGTIAEDIDGERCEFVKGNICDRALTDELFAKYQFDYVVNFAAESHVDRSVVDPGIFLQTNILGTGVLMDACRNYADKTGRRLTFEYSLVGGVNDTKEDAEELIGLAAPLGSHVNLIPVNPIKERDFVQSNHAAIAAFQKRLEKGGINVTIRREMGRDIDGACGQLRRRHMEEQSE